MAGSKRPNSRRNLDIAINRLASAGGDPLRLRTALANTVVGQMLPEGTVKGGSTLKIGWEGFTGALVRREPAKPKGIPGEYVMQPYEVKLSYNEKPWCTVPLEIGHDKIGGAGKVEWANDLIRLINESEG
ncbi:hypothetical protein [Curtanaerobium respiraculi]|uniref:hypothetical protein n=1 Tax=Curtanaerobium respiraculi TaxID=2949669 RepID=UPI0024B3B1A5|nr:hypothetical protein [Curtanaerobium respiraculi]